MLRSTVRQTRWAPGAGRAAQSTTAALVPSFPPSSGLIASRWTSSQVSTPTSLRAVHPTVKWLPSCASRPYSAAATATPNTLSSPFTMLEKPDYLNEAETVIWHRLVAEFEPVELVVRDISGGCGSMYGIEIVSNKFDGQGMLMRQRMVNKVLADLMKNWHGVQLRTVLPSERAD